MLRELINKYASIILTNGENSETRVKDYKLKSILKFVMRQNC